MFIAQLFGNTIADMSHTQTVSAIVLSLLLAILGMFIASFPLELYTFFVAPMFLGDNFMNWITGGLFGEIAINWFPPFAQGAAGTGFGLGVCALIFRKANFVIVAYSVGALIVALATLSLMIEFTQYGATLKHVAVIGNTVGALVGLGYTAQFAKETSGNLF